MTKPLRIAILTHSTNPRGGVVHALELGEALGRLGHEPTVYAPDVTGAARRQPTGASRLCPDSGHTRPNDSTSAKGQDPT